MEAAGQRGSASSGERSRSPRSSIPTGPNRSVRLSRGFYTRRQRASASRRQWKTGHLYAGLARLFRLLRNARGADSPHSLGPIATAGRSVAPMENPTAPPRSTHRKWGLRVGCKEHGRQRPRSLVSRPQQSSLYWALKCILQITRSAILVPIVLAQLLEPPCTDPYAQSRQALSADWSCRETQLHKSHPCQRCRRHLGKSRFGPVRNVTRSGAG